MKIIKKEQKVKTIFFFLSHSLAHTSSIIWPLGPLRVGPCRADHNSQRVERCSTKSWTGTQSPNNQYGERIRRLRKRDHVFNSTKSREMRWWGGCWGAPTLGATLGATLGGSRNLNHAITHSSQDLFFWNMTWGEQFQPCQVCPFLLFFFLLLALSRDTLWTDKNIRRIFSPFGY